MRLANTMGMALALFGCAPGTPPANPPPVTVVSPNDVKAATSTAKEPSTATDPCAAERTTLAIESCVAEQLRLIESDIQAALTRFARVFSARGVGDAAALVAASQ